MAELRITGEDPEEGSFTYEFVDGNITRLTERQPYSFVLLSKL